MNWILYAFLSALFAALTAILAKVGVKDVNSNLATAVRTVVILLFAWGIVFFQQIHRQLTHISRFSLIFLILSGITTGLSWLFYFRALQIGEASKVVPIDKLSLVLTIILAVVLLKEKLTVPVLLGSILMTAGAILISFSK
ncbi:MAG TPA: EamA family transporter [Patescibacteria group bacterium]|nr:EamA family transporter [Patescibacteria group bacterium]